MTRKKVLWVDDEIEFLRSHIMFLETRGYSVTPAFNGDDALQILRDSPRRFDIVLLDEQMPGKDGLTTLEEIKHMLPDLPVVMVTKSEEEQVMEEALGKHIDGYLTKPVNPSQILSVCKRLLDSKTILTTQASQRFLRSYSANRASLQNQPNSKEWIKLYENLTRWDVELEGIEDEGMRQTHAGQKSDADSLFARHMIENYVEWTNGNRDAPLFSTKVVDTFVVPRLNEGDKVAFMALDSLRLDQLLAIVPLLKKHFSIAYEMFYSILPSSKPYTRLSLLSGLFPDQIHQLFPQALMGTGIPDEDAGGVPAGEVLLREKLAAAGHELGEQMVYAEISDISDGTRFLKALDSHADKRLVALMVDFVDLLIQSRSAATVVQQIAPDECAFRRLTHSWFLYSTIYRIIQELGRRGFVVMLTAGNGSILCTRGTELYGDRTMDLMARYRFGKKVSCDERHALFVPEPSRFRLPQPEPEATWLLLHDNYYFIPHDLFENYTDHYRNSFQNGGISLEEIIVPFVMLRPQ